MIQKKQTVIFQVLLMLKLKMKLCITKETIKQNNDKMVFLNYYAVVVQVNMLMYSMFFQTLLSLKIVINTTKQCMKKMRRMRSMGIKMTMKRYYYHKDKENDKKKKKEKEKDEVKHIIVTILKHVNILTNGMNRR